jgi:hypothetical protein
MTTKRNKPIILMLVQTTYNLTSAVEVVCYVDLVISTCRRCAHTKGPLDPSSGLKVRGETRLSLIEVGSRIDIVPRLPRRFSPAYLEAPLYNETGPQTLCVPAFWPLGKVGS